MSYNCIFLGLKSLMVGFDKLKDFYYLGLVLITILFGAGGDFRGA